MNAIRTVGDIINELPPIGHNRAGLSPLEALQIDIDDLSELARGTLTGVALTSEAQAAAVQSLVARARGSAKAADDARKDAKELHLAAGRAVDASYKPVITTAERIRDAGLAALGPWLQAKDDAQRAAAIEAKRIADEAAAAALALARVTDSADLDAVEAREAAINAAAKAAVDAIKADKARAVASSGEGRGISLRSEWQATLMEPHLYLAHLKRTDAMRLKLALAEMAAADVRAGARVLPGVEIVEVRVAR